MVGEYADVVTKHLHNAADRRATKHAETLGLPASPQVLILLTASNDRIVVVEDERSIRSKGRKVCVRVVTGKGVDKGRRRCRYLIKARHRRTSPSRSIWSLRSIAAASPLTSRLLVRMKYNPPATNRPIIQEMSTLFSQVAPGL